MVFWGWGIQPAAGLAGRGVPCCASSARSQGRSRQPRAPRVRLRRRVPRLAAIVQRSEDHGPRSVEPRFHSTSRRAIRPAPPARSHGRAARRVRWWGAARARACHARSVAARGVPGAGLASQSSPGRGAWAWRTPRDVWLRPIRRWSKRRRCWSWRSRSCERPWARQADLSVRNQPKQQLASPRRSLVPVPCMSTPGQYAAAQTIATPSQRMPHRQGSPLRTVSQPRTCPPPLHPNACWGRGQHVLGCVSPALALNRSCRYTARMPTVPWCSRGPFHTGRRKGEGARLR